MTLNKIGLVTIASLVLLHVVGAQQLRPGEYRVYRSGDVSCGAWTEGATRTARTGNSLTVQSLRLTWVMGFLTGVAWTSTATDPMANTDSEHDSLDQRAQRYLLLYQRLLLSCR